MNLVQLRFKTKAYEIVKNKPRYWEYLLYSQLLDDEIAYARVLLSDDSLIKQRVQLKFNTIKTDSDLKEMVAEILAAKGGVISKFLQDLLIFLSFNNIDAFGPSDISGNPAAIMILSRKTATLYFDIGMQLREFQFDSDFFDQFFERNLDNSVEKHRLIRIAMIEASKCVILAAQGLLADIERFGQYIRELVKSQISGVQSTAFTLTAIPNEKFLSAVAAVESLSLRQSAHGSESTFGNSEKASRHTQSFNCELNNLFSAYDVAKWLTNRSTITLRELRSILLPLDLFPGAVIDDINERAYDLTCEAALEEAGDVVSVQRGVLLQVLAAWDA